MGKAKHEKVEFIGEFNAVRALEMLLRIQLRREGMRYIPGTLEVSRNGGEWQSVPDTLPWMNVTE